MATKHVFDQYQTNSISLVMSMVCFLLDSEIRVEDGDNQFDMTAFLTQIGRRCSILTNTNMYYLQRRKIRGFSVYSTSWPGR